ncbi:hypothetical protein F5878DRAFT_630941 [Lentinula raphanica]|uniref:Heme haloperoxidase family profile domain-containing protein n=1 Tax=Lentinula raphanica TaxID=153919 RepID=A0AA38U9M4_9AGAR|nr:hypothetical protein F5878DRAFT_630941 [Lentinula raphanica]
MKLFPYSTILPVLAGRLVTAICPMAHTLLSPSARNMNESLIIPPDTNPPSHFYQTHQATTQKRGIIGFDAASQHVSTTGQHAFVPPGPDDRRGPCPGLNAMANHGYIPHNGFATIDEFVQGTHEVFGMGQDLALVLSVYGTVLDGDILSASFSIGKGDNTFSIFGSPTSQNGLTDSHNNYETDASPTRGDLDQYGDNTHIQLSLFRELYNLQSHISDPSQVNYDIDLLTAFRVTRFQQSIEQNPLFFNGAFSGIAVQPAAYQFIFRYMANKSEEYPEGRLDREVLKSFFAVRGEEEGDFVYTPGHERIPDNWYKRAPGDEYGLVPFIIELNTIALAHPEFLSIGGNTGRVNTFTGVDLGDLTGGVFDSTTLLEGNNLGCFVLLQVAAMAIPSGLEGIVEGVFGRLSEVLNPLLARWECPRFGGINEALLERFPGYSRHSVRNG